MARPRDPAHVQAAKGFPGKRRSKTEKALAEATRLAELLASAPAESGESLSPPAMMLDQRLKPAITVWRELSGELSSMNLLTTIDRYTFAVYCLAVADYFAAVDDILANGPVYWATTHQGNKLRRPNPSVAIKERLAKFIFDAGAEFGLTPLTRYSLLREQAQHGAGGVIPHHSPRGAPPTQEPPSADLIGFAARLDTPGRLQ